MPFVLRNAKAIFQRFMDRTFTNQIGRNAEVYVNDILVRSRVEWDHLADLEKTFVKIRRDGLRLK